MKVTLCAVGKVRSGPELELINYYKKLFNVHRKKLGIGPLEVFEIDTKKAKGTFGEGLKIRSRLSSGAYSILLDEKGLHKDSVEFSQLILKLREANVPELLIIIGGADGVDPSIKDEVNYTLSFGKMVWPHLLMRVMVVEQLYRTCSILSGTPYHRE